MAKATSRLDVASAAATRDSSATSPSTEALDDAEFLAIDVEQLEEGVEELKPEDLQELLNYRDDGFTPIVEQTDPPGHRAGYVAIIGRPNAGKSTLQNALLGQKISIVTDKAQTTRHKVLGILSEPGYQMVLLDTPGVIKERKNRLDDRMMSNVEQAVKDADALLVIVDANDKPQEALQFLEMDREWKGPPIGLVLNKVDLLKRQEGEVDNLCQLFSLNDSVKQVFPVSAINSKGIDAVMQWAAQQLPEGPSLYPKDIVSMHPERFFVAEIVREKVFMQYRQEIPYAITVQVTDYKERSPPAKDFVAVEVIVEHDRQRGIIIGKGGTALKKLATAARLSVEDFLDRPVYLELSVKVRENWRKKDTEVQRLGY